MGVSFFGGDSLCFPFETHLKTGVPTLTKTNVNGLSVLDPVHLPKMEVDLPHASGRITPNSREKQKANTFCRPAYGSSIAAIIS